MTDFLVSEVFASFENIKKDNTTLVAIDLAKVFRAASENGKEGTGMKKSITLSLTPLTNSRKFFSLATKE